jgi:hypothetical protein
MSSIYKEAVRITSHLGYQYLWIDSLCLIQDSPSDWEKEAASMAAVYGNSTCNIAFSLPPEIRYGRDREDPRALGACILRPATASIDGIYTFSHTIPCRQYNTPAGPQHLASSRLRVGFLRAFAEPTHRLLRPAKYSMEMWSSLLR